MHFQNFSTRGVKISEVGESNSEILSRGVFKIELGDWDLFCKIQNFSGGGVKIFEVGESNFFQVGESNSKMVEWGR